MDARALNRVMDSARQALERRSVREASTYKDEERDDLIRRLLRRVALNGGGKVCEDLDPPPGYAGRKTTLVMVYAGDKPGDLSPRRREWVVGPLAAGEFVAGGQEGVPRFEVRIVGEELPVQVRREICGCAAYDDGSTSECSYHDESEELTGPQARAELSRLKARMLQGDTDAAVRHRRLVSSIRSESSSREEEARARPGLLAAAKKRIAGLEADNEALVSRVREAEREIVTQSEDLQEAYARIEDVNKKRGDLLERLSPVTVEPPPLFGESFRWPVGFVAAVAVAAAVLIGVPMLFYGYRNGFTPNSEFFIFVLAFFATLGEVALLGLFLTRRRK